MLVLADLNMNPFEVTWKRSNSQSKSIEEYLKPVFASEAEIRQYTHTLYLVVPAMANYRYALVSAEHDFEPCPCKAVYHPQTSVFPPEMPGTPKLCDNQDELIRWLAIALKNSTTTRIIRALISQASQPRQAASNAN